MSTKTVDASHPAADVNARGTSMTIRPTTQLDIVSTTSGRAYSVTMTPPPTSVPNGGYPVLWILDGQGYNGFAVNLVTNLGMVDAIDAPLVVGIGYPTTDVSDILDRRGVDLTPSQGDEGTRAMQPGVAFGGLEAFLDMLRDDVLPALTSRFAVNVSRMALWGHSLGGLAVLYALFTRSSMFASYLAISPSIWWDGKVLLQHEGRFAARITDGRTTPRVFIAVGGTEQDVPTQLVGSAFADVESAQAAADRGRMVDNAHDLYLRLNLLVGAAGYEVRFVCADGESHMTAPFVTTPRALDLAFPLAPGKALHSPPLIP